MKAFMDQDFLLETETARKLYHDYAAKMPVLDYHCHISPKEIAEDRKFENITQVWLGCDHYKWRQMRSNGVEEKYITGDASDREKFQKWAETLEKALSTVVCHPVKCTGAGRTDAGVHAETYIANFRTTSTIPCDRIPLAVNTRLPKDIVVVKATQVPMEFNAIGSCHRKEYTYRIYNSRLGNPFYVDRAWFYPKHLDEAVMQRAADQFVGTHDFRAVRSVGTETRTTVRTVYYFNVSRTEELIECKVCANGFLYNMVRAMTGTIVYAAEGKLSPEDIPAILASGNRTLAGPTVPPGGLYMTKLWYDEDVL